MCMTIQSRSLVLRSLGGAALDSYPLIGQQRPWWRHAEVYTVYLGVWSLSQCVWSTSRLPCRWRVRRPIHRVYVVCLLIRPHTGPDRHRSFGPLVTASPPSCYASWETRKTIRIRWILLGVRVRACIMNEPASFIKSCWLHTHWSHNVGVDVVWWQVHIYLPDWFHGFLNGVFLLNGLYAFTRY